MESNGTNKAQIGVKTSPESTNQVLAYILKHHRFQSSTISGAAHLSEWHSYWRAWLLVCMNFGMHYFWSTPPSPSPFHPPPPVITVPSTAATSGRSPVPAPSRRTPTPLPASPQATGKLTRSPHDWRFQTQAAMAVAPFTPVSSAISPMSATAANSARRQAHLLHLRQPMPPSARPFTTPWPTARPSHSPPPIASATVDRSISASPSPFASPPASIPSPQLRHATTAPA